MKIEQYQKDFQKQIDLMSPQMLDFHWENPEVYETWLAQTFFIVRHTSHFICMSAALIPVENRSEHYHMIEHLKEEEHHDMLLIKDLEFFNKKPSDFAELPETTLVWQNLYYWLSLRKPRSILGHSLCIEGLAGQIGTSLVKKLQKVYPKEAYQFLELHFEADKKHFEQGLELMKAFDKDDLEDIKLVQKQSSILYLNMLNAIMRNVVQVQTHKSAAA